MYLHIGKVDLIVLKEANEDLEVLFGREVMSAVWPYCLQERWMRRLPNIYSLYL